MRAVELVRTQYESMLLSATQSALCKTSHRPELHLRWHKHTGQELVPCETVYAQTLASSDCQRLADNCRIAVAWHSLLPQLSRAVQINVQRFAFDFYGFIKLVIGIPNYNNNLCFPSQRRTFLHACLTQYHSPPLFGCLIGWYFPIEIAHFRQLLQRLAPRFVLEPVLLLAAATTIRRKMTTAAALIAKRAATRTRVRACATHCSFCGVNTVLGIFDNA